MVLGFLMNCLLHGFTLRCMADKGRTEREMFRDLTQCNQHHSSFILKLHGLIRHSEIHFKSLCFHFITLSSFISRLHAFTSLRFPISFQELMILLHYAFQFHFKTSCFHFVMLSSFISRLHAFTSLRFPVSFQEFMLSLHYAFFQVSVQM